MIAQAEGAELIVFPELALTGLDTGGINPISQRHSVFDTLRGLAEERQQYYVVGFAEQSEEHLYNAAALVGAQGVMAVYRKIHLNEADRQWATPGERWVSFDLPLGRLGLLIGHDADFPEAGRILALRGCDVIACPAALPGPFHCAHPGTDISQPAPIPTGPDDHHWHHYRVRGGENNCYFAFANVHMPDAGLSGLSGIFGPDTFLFPRQEALLTSATGCVQLAIDTSNLDSAYPNSAVRRKDLVVMRLPHHYPKLLER